MSITIRGKTLITANTLINIGIAIISGVTKTITIYHTQCGSSDVTNFTVLVSINHSSLKTVVNGGRVENSNGYDINFYSDSGYTTLLHWETEFYDAVNGVGIFWVKIPSISHTTDTLFYIRYGDPTITTFQGGSLGTAWSTNYQAIWHLGDGTTLTLLDSTSNGIDGRNDNGVAPAIGMIGGGAEFTYFTNYIQLMNDMPAFNSKTSLSISMWIKANNISDFQALFTKMSPGTFNNDILIYIASNQLICQIDNGADGGGAITIFSSDFVTNFAHIVCTYDGNGSADYDKVKMYVNGLSQSISFGYTVPAITADQTGFNQNMGWYNNVQLFGGILDEVRVNTTTLTESWIITEYNNQRNPGNIGVPGFLTFT